MKKYKYRIITYNSDSYPFKVEKKELTWFLTTLWETVGFFPTKETCQEKIIDEMNNDCKELEEVVFEVNPWKPLDGMESSKMFANDIDKLIKKYFE